MAIRFEDKQSIVTEVNKIAQGALSAVVADYRGVAVSEMTKLREQARSQNIYVRVVRNTLAKRAISQTEFDCLNDVFVGPTIIGFSLEEPGASAKLFKSFAKDHQDFEIKACAIGGVAYGADKIDVVASLPSKDEAIALLMSVMNAPVTKLARTLNEIPSKVTRVVAAVGDSKQAA